MSEKHSIEERLDMLEKQVNNTSNDGLKRNESDLSLNYQDNGDIPNVSFNYVFSLPF